MTQVKDLVQFVSRRFHIIENVESPVNSVVVVGVVVSANVAHSSVARNTLF